MALDRMRKRQPTREYGTAIVRCARMDRGPLEPQRAAGEAFDADNTYYYTNNIPFADHGALLDRDRRCHGALYFHVGSTRRTA